MRSASFQKVQDFYEKLSKNCDALLTLGEKEVLLPLPDIFGKDPSCHVSLAVASRHKDIPQRVLPAQGPGNGLVPRSRGEMQGHRRQSIFQDQVILLRIAKLVIHEVDVVIRIQRGKRTPYCKSVSRSDEITSNFDRFCFLVLWGRFFHDRNGKYGETVDSRTAIRIANPAFSRSG